MPDQRRFHLLCLLVYSGLCLAWSARIGPLFSWDYLHYHLYVVQAWWQGRLPEELFAASAQAYLNPWPHLPFYLVSSLVNDTYLGTLLMAFFHSLNLWVLHFVTCQLVPPDKLFSRVAVFVGVLLGALSPGFLLELGTSYGDVVVSIPALLAVYLLLRRAKGAYGADWGCIYLAGLLAGASVGMKPSLLVFCMPLLVAQMIVAKHHAFALGWRALLSGVVGGGVFGAAHMLMLWRNFGNPVFPLFNATFSSPWFPPVNVVSDRFRSETWLDALLFPWSMADNTQRVSFEAMMVDIRPLWLIGLVILLLLLGLFARLMRRPTGKDLPAGERLFWLGLVFFFPVWIYTSGNVRYAVQSLMLLGPAIALLTIKLAAWQRHLSMFALLLPATAQAALATNLNFPNLVDAQPPVLGKEWFDIKLPAPYDKTPAYYLSLQTQSFASLADRFPRKARFLNLIGQNTLEPGGKVFSAVEKLSRENGLMLRTLYTPLSTKIGKESPDEMVASQNALLSDYGYLVVETDCFTINNRAPHVELVSCAIEKAPPLVIVELERRKRIDQRISFWERECPKLFYPAGFQSIQATQTRRRFYLATDFQIIAMPEGRLIARDNFNGARELIELENESGQRVLSGCPSRRVP